MNVKTLQLLVFTVAGIALAGSAQAENYKKEYCANADYVVGGSKYPHLHCDKDYYVYSASGSDHKDMARGTEVYCERTRAVIDTVKALNPNTVGKQQMLDSTLAFARVNCKK